MPSAGKHKFGTEGPVMSSPVISARSEGGEHILTARKSPEIVRMVNSSAEKVRMMHFNREGRREGRGHR